MYAVYIISTSLMKARKSGLSMAVQSRTFVIVTADGFGLGHRRERLGFPTRTGCLGLATTFDQNVSLRFEIRP